MSTFLLQVCAAERCSSSLFNEYRHLTHAHTKALLARASAASARLRRPRADRAPATPLRKRRRLHGCHSLHRLIQRRIDMMAPNHEIRRRSSAADKNPVESSIASSAATTTVFASTSAASSAADAALSRSPDEDAAGGSDEPGAGDITGSAAMPPPPPPSGRETSPTRQSRSTSSASRNANRLSLTLPIAPPSSDPSRPTPTYAATPSSVCPTPVESSGQATPVDANEFIIAIAAQERRVLELKEELVRAEAELLVLKKQWTSQEAYSKKSESRKVETPRRAAVGADDESTPSRHSVDLDRRKSLLLQNQSTPNQGRRKVLRGGHTRTLSLLSPQKSESGFAIHEDPEAETIKLPPVDRRAAQLTNTTLNKRASWQPQSHSYQASVPGLVEDFRLGLKAFVEDIRQITVGDEPIMGSSTRSSQSQATDSPSNRSASGDHDTIRPSHSARPKVSNVFDSPGSDVSTPSKGRTSMDSKAKTRKSKHFSWTPLAFDSLDDDGWTSWESPASTKSTTRWSGSTVNNAGIEDIASIPEAREEVAEQS